MIYLTYNDAPSGIYSSQVIDVCDFFRKDLDSPIRLVALISVRNYWSSRRKIRSGAPDAIVLPMFPGPQNWERNYSLLSFFFSFLGKRSVIARGPFATSLALRLKRNKKAGSVCFDARGAYDAEFKEYDVAKNEELKATIFEIEKSAVLNADFRIAVSHKLVAYWKDKFGYAFQKHSVIPCTIKARTISKPDQAGISATRSLLGFSNEDVLLVYSGSSAGWHSFQLLDEFLRTQMQRNTGIKVLFLVDKLPPQMKVLTEFQGRVVVKWLSTNQVAATIACCDYGLLIRERSVTNQVSSPVKFAEYLGSGLNILISPEIGDYSEFVQANSCGYVIGAADQQMLFPLLSGQERHRNADLAMQHFSKPRFLNEYRAVIKNIE